MNCTNLTEDGLECGSDMGVICDECFAREVADHAYLRNVSFGAVRQSEQDKIDLRDAGRGHLVQP